MTFKYFFKCVLLLLAALEVFCLEDALPTLINPKCATLWVDFPNVSKINLLINRSFYMKNRLISKIAKKVTFYIKQKYFLRSKSYGIINAESIFMTQTLSTSIFKVLQSFKCSDILIYKNPQVKKGLAKLSFELNRNSFLGIFDNRKVF